MPGYDADGCLTRCPGCGKGNDWIANPTALALGVRLRYLRLIGTMTKTQAANAYRSGSIPDRSKGWGPEKR
jgi:hypothetical protein